MQQYSTTLLDFETLNWNRGLSDRPGLLLDNFVAFEVVVLAVFRVDDSRAMVMELFAETDIGNVESLFFFIVTAFYSKMRNRLQSEHSNVFIITG
jgi:hypothetical protein